MSAHHPLTPPSDASTEAGAFNNDVISTPRTNSNNAALGTPASMGVDESMDGEDEEPQTSSDEDQDMSDGGAALTMTLSRAEEINTELDFLDAEVMGPDNMYSMMALSAPDQYQPSYSPGHQDDNFQEQWSTMDDVQHNQGHQIPTNMPLPMLEVSQVSQDLHNGQLAQEHAAVADEPNGADDLHGGTFQQSNPPSILLPYFQNFQNDGIDAASPQTEYVTMFQVAPANPPTAQHGWLNPPQVLQTQNQAPSHINALMIDEDDLSDVDNPEIEDQMNQNLSRFLYSWGTHASANGRTTESRHRGRGPSLKSLREHRDEELRPVERSDLQGDRCDIQRINWDSLGVTRVMARQERRATYKNYANLRNERQWHPRLHGSRLEDDQNFFRFRRMDFNHEINLAHFQLRNLIACASRDHIFYAGRSQVLHWNPHSGSAQPEVAMDLTNPNVQPAHWITGASPGISVSSLSLNHDILVAGGFSGEYALVNLKAQKNTAHIEGLVTENPNSITNHIQVHLSRSSDMPVVAFASNDNHVRTLDVETNTFISSHHYEHAINCTAISPDQRLRVLVGDFREVMICNAENGELVAKLDGHRDYGFSCDWADDGWTVATGNQDMQVKIWDARKWCNSSGIAQCVATIPADMAGVRKLKFSPLGSGKRVLLAAEPADIISVIDGESFTSKQTLSFFGEIGGVDFTNDGQDIFVANCDEMRGGLMQFERCDHATHSLYGVEDCDPRRKSRNRLRRSEGHDWKRTDADVVKHPKSRGTEEQRRRKVARLGLAMGHF